VIRRRRLIVAAAACLAATLGAACASTSSLGSRVRGYLPQTTAATTTTTTTTVPSSAERQCLHQHLATETFAPLPSLPTPGHMPADSFMARIAARGKLIAGVDQNTLGFGYRDPATGQLQGFDIDMAKQIATAIFGTPNVEFRAVTSAQRKTAIESGAVDVVVSLMTMTCDRWQDMLFSSEYYRGFQNVLVRSDSPIKSLADLRGKRICATVGSTSIRQIPHLHAIADGVATRPECLVRLQDGIDDALTTDDTIMWGFQFQDPNTRVVHLARPDQIETEPYGVAVNLAHPQFVRFINAVLARLDANGTWEQLYGALRARLTQRFDPPRIEVPAVAPPVPVYGRQS
jgi:polar amino acid transport system substrate-binding protein